MKIPTKDAAGNPNGWVLPIWSALEHPELRPEQVYMTAVAPHSVKGPHLHKRRRGLFCCISGLVDVVTKQGKMYTVRRIGQGSAPVLVPAGVPSAIYNDFDDEALVINMPSPAWSAEDPDEWPVEDWDYVR